MKKTNLMHKIHHVTLHFIVLLLCTQARAAHPQFHNGLSLEGYTGILNTPSAHVTDEGWMNAIYTNQMESNWRQKPLFQDNFLFSVGFFNFIELGGRFFEAPGVGRDLSANAKITSAQLTLDRPYLPVIAAGVADPAGGAVFLKTSYLVISEDFWRLRISSGYGHGPDRLKGGFAGVEFKAFDWAYLLGEYDTSETNVGLRLVLPQFWKVPVRFTATAKTSLTDMRGNFDIAFGVSIPLDFKMRNDSPPSVGKAPVTTGIETAKSRTHNSAPIIINPVSKIGTSESEIQNSKFKIASLLISEGFINVRVGTKERSLFVEYENTIFNHNELDALGLVAGISCEAAPEGLDTLIIISKRRNIRMVAIEMPLHELRTFLDGSEDVQKLRELLIVNFESPMPVDVVYAAGDENSGILNTSLILSPGLTTFVGTEVGAFDYSLSLKAELTTMLWKGAVANARWNVPLSWSSNLDDGKEYSNRRQPAQLERLMLFQAFKPLSNVMLNLGGGMILHDQYGTLNEAAWSPKDGQHRFKIVQGWNESSATHARSRQLLGSYRFFFAPLDLSLEGMAGRFWSEDTGFSLEMKRFWEDTAVSLFYKDTKGIDEKNWKAVGITFSFPLTSRRDMKPLVKMQLRGSNDWSYSQETTLKNNNYISMQGELNYLPPYQLAVNPQPSLSLIQSFYNRDRLSSTYIRQHLDRLRESWLKYHYGQ